jgi:hypothetical protein
MRILVLTLLVLSWLESTGQRKVIQQIQKSVTALESGAHLTFLASDEMRGRDTGSPEIDIAANYISTHLKIFGAKPVPGTSGFFQEVRLKKIAPAKGVSLKIGDEAFKQVEDLVYMNGASVALNGEIVFVGYGSASDFEKVDVKGKIVVALAGSNATTNAVQALLTDAPAKGVLAGAHGASALIEIMMLPGLPWQSIVNFLNAERMVTEKESANSIPHLWMKKSESAAITALMESRKAHGELKVDASATKSITGKNVAGVIEGTDPTLKKEWIVISAHYDHVGVKKNAMADSIYNGARDNAIGTVALMQAAKFFGQNRPKRSVLFLAVTGEEKGLLGSEWYTNHPLIPLRETVFNLNCDGAGYNDMTLATIMDFNRTSVDPLFRQACEAFGLTLKGDPAPEQNLYERSDNVNFAVKGVPAIDLAPGVKAFDKELFKYYHQPIDEVSSLDINYIEKFHRSFVYGAYLVANAKERPTWVKGDKFESAGKKLYGGN